MLDEPKDVTGLYKSSRTANAAAVIQAAAKAQTAASDWERDARTLRDSTRRSREQSTSTSQTLAAVRK